MARFKNKRSPKKAHKKLKIRKNLKKYRKIYPHLRLAYQIAALKRKLNLKLSQEKLRHRKTYTQDDLERAGAEVKANELTMEQASEKYHIPSSSISDFINKKYKSNELVSERVSKKDLSDKMKENNKKKERHQSLQKL